MLAVDDYFSLAVGRARAGQLYLAHTPGLAEWPTRIVRPLKMGSTKDCMLAQLFGSFREGVEALGLDEIETVALGFRGTTAELRTMNDFTRYYATLTATWELERKILIGSF